MTQEDQDAVIGRVVRERKELQDQLALLEAEADRLGNVFQILGDMLKRGPQGVGFNNHPVNPNYVNMNGPMFKVEDIQGNRIVTLTNEIRAIHEKLSQLKSHAARLGI